jgi:hypothetical protein
VEDAQSPRALVTIVVRTSSGATVRTFPLGSRTVGRNHTAAVPGPRVAGTYRYVVKATDVAGNQQVRAGSNLLTVH